MTTSHDPAVVDGVKAVALLAVVAGHALAWNATGDLSFGATLDAEPGLWWATWGFQVLPLFFLLSATGLRRVANATDGRALAARISLLVVPVLPLYVITAITAGLVGSRWPTLAQVAGFIPVQLTWFIAVYVLIVSAAPLLVRLRGLGLAAWLTAIPVVDIMRFTVHSACGWINMLLVWSTFTVLGLRLAELRQLPRRYLAGVLVSAVAFAGILISFGPYSKALVSAEHIPGASNLAPPTTVLLCVGLAQTATLLLAWPTLQRLFGQPRVAGLISSFSVRAMQVYLYHLLILCLLALAVSVVLPVPATLSLAWWVEHGAVFAGAAGISFVLAPSIRAMSTFLATLIAAPWARIRPLARPIVTLLGLTTGLSLLVVAGIGVGNLGQTTHLVGIPIHRSAAVVAVVVLCGVMTAMGQPRRTTP
jgi:hypothetical protein